MGLHGGYDNRNSRERNKNEIDLKWSLLGAPIDQNALRFSQMQYGLLGDFTKVQKFTKFTKRQLSWQGKLAK